MTGQDTEVNENVVLQDYIIRLDNLKTCLELTDSIQNVYPIWLCPARDWNKWNIDTYTRKNGIMDECYVDVGVYG